VFLSVVQASGLAETLKGEVPLTVIAPSDEAMRKLSATTLLDLVKPENRARLAALVKGHLIVGSMLKEDLAKKTTVETFSGARAAIGSSDTLVSFNGGVLTRSDLAAKNGVLHCVDTVTLPADVDVLKTLADAGTFKVFHALVVASDLAINLQTLPFTVLAPTDTAMAQLPQGAVDRMLSGTGKAELRAFLLRHMTAGRVFAQAALWRRALSMADGSRLPVSGTREKPVFGGASGAQVNIGATNGVVHGIDAVLPASPSAPPGGGR
jgi:transforming growth factor-beta-induced protein